MTGWSCALLVWLAAGCATARVESGADPRPFSFQHDTFAYPNELVWEYNRDDRGRWRPRARDPKPAYTHRCFVLARTAKQFFLHARFDPAQAPADDLTYRRLIREVTRSSPRQGRPEDARIVIPGYASLREFSESWSGLLQSESGAAWQSYAQRGHWRMVFPFTRRHQERMALRWIDSLEQNQVAAAHLVQFPTLRINHAVVVFGAETNDARIEFHVYDPNAPDQPVPLTYDRARRGFEFQANDYFPGGALNVYEIYRGFCY